ncbi:aromatic ring-opening dioxygenase LigA [Streptomyces thermolilacinus]|uniref:aromatic ring-opening dioxygenase LigA n=1 Tax=Streptomyces thermolilacinus TaxID=285540 RepID=UPI0033DB6C9E
MSALERARRLLDTPPPPHVPGQLAADLPAPPRPRLVCDVPQPQHDGPVRPYLCGPKCDRHKPRPATDQNGHQR